MQLKMYYRRQNLEISLLHLKLRELWVESFAAFSIHGLEKVLANKEEFLKIAADLKAIDTNKRDANYFTGLYYLINALLLMVQGYKNKFSGAEGGSLIEAGRLNAEQFIKLCGDLDQT